MPNIHEQIQKVLTYTDKQMHTKMIKRLCILLATITICATASFAQNQNEKEETPEERAHKHTEKLVKDLDLTDAQEFYVDSILVSCYTGYKDAYDDLIRSGRSEYEIYKQLAELWQKKRLDALKKVLDEQQYIRYLRSIGMGKEYKKGKDGKYYLKSELKKK